MFKFLLHRRFLYRALPDITQLTAVTQAPRLRQSKHPYPMNEFDRLLHISAWESDIGLLSSQ